ncbi:MAG TPA: ABC transporter permease subunit, partial [Pyrodictiaceae archaeon]|nr:ABC transporter permease subunit [Pyrodictiaceae archaeon]
TLGTAGILLGIMITPYAAAMIREAYSAIPLSYVEAMYSLGATKLEAIRLRLGMIKPAIIAALVLGFGRAVGETVAVALVVGNSLTLTLSLTSPGTTVASLIANMFASAPYYTYMESALFAGGLALFIIGLVVNSVGLLVIKKWEERIGLHM